MSFHETFLEILSPTQTKEGLLFMYRFRLVVQSFLGHADLPFARALSEEAIQQAFDALFLQQWRFSDWREVPGSGEGSTSLPSLMDVQVTATALGPWGIPYARYTIGCGGACSQLR